VSTQLQRPHAGVPLVTAGWGVALLVVVLAYVAKPEDELGFALVVGSIAVALGVWTYLRRSRIAALVSLVLGLLWTLLFGGYAVAGIASDEAALTLVLVDDIVAVVGGVMIVAGAFAVLRGREQGRK